MRLKGHVAIVTGAARGIGFGIAERLLAEGAQVALADIRQDGVEAAAERLGADRGRVLPLTIDIANEESVASCFDAVAARFGQPQIVVNVAAIWSDYPFDELTLDEWRRIHLVNTDGAFLVSRAAFKAMKAHGYGRIVNIASSVFLTAKAGYSHYTSSKGAVIAMTRVLATEGGPHGITANAVAPGLIVTEGTIETFKESGIAAGVKAQAIPREGRPEDIAEAVSFLVGPGAGFTTGQTIYVNGGTRFG